MIKAAVKKRNLAFLIGIFFLSPVAEATYLGTTNGQDGVVAGGSVNWSVTFPSVDRGRLEVDNMIAGNGNLPPFTVSPSRSPVRGFPQRTDIPCQVVFWWDDALWKTAGDGWRRARILRIRW